MPKKAVELNNQAVRATRAGKFESGIKLFEKAHSLDPNNQHIHNNLAKGCLDYSIRCYKESQITKAIKYTKKHIKLEPSGGGYVNLGVYYQKLGDLKSAENSLSKAIELDPKNIKAINNLAHLLRLTGKISQAIKYCQKALKINPNFPPAHINLGTSLLAIGDHQRATEHFEKAIEIDSNLTTLLPHLFDARRHMCNWEDIIKVEKNLNQANSKKLEKGGVPPEPPFYNLIRVENLQENQKVAKAWSTQIENNLVGMRSFTHSKAGRKLRVGYVSNGFRDFPTGHNITRVFELHDKRRFKVFAYSWGKYDKSQWRKRIRNSVSEFVNIDKLSHENSAKRINRDQIDILVDLKGYTQDSRLHIFGLKPAPIQIGYLGFPGTTGASFIDYMIADQVVLPKNHRKYYSERILYLPDCYRPASLLNTHHPTSNHQVNKLKLFGTKAFVFGSFNQAYKITPEMFNAWMKILNKVPGSVLWQLESNSFFINNLRAEAKRQGINPRRIVSAPDLPKDEHLARMRFTDLVLDTHPVNGHTTTIDALSVGIPVITILGKHFASRVSASCLTNVGFNQLTIKNIYEYEKLAVNLATNPQKLLKIRGVLLKNLKTKPLFDTKNYVRNLEKAYTMAWQKYESGHASNTN